MSPELEELRRLGESADPVRAAREWAVAVGRARLLDLRPEIESLRHSNEWLRGATTWDEMRGPECALTVAELGSARTVVQAAMALDHYGDVSVDDVVFLAQQMGARWLPKLPARLLRNRWNHRWELGRQLVRCELSAHPSGPLYLEQMITGIRRVYPTLRDDAALLDEIWPFFHSDRLGLVLGQRDIPVAGWKVPPGMGWTDDDLWWRVALTRLAAEGHVDRARLHRAAVAALSMDAPWQRVRWYAALLEQMDRTLDEIAGEASSYLALLRSRNPKTVSVGQEAVRALLPADRLRPEDFLDVADAPFFGTDKTTALVQIKLLEPFAAERAWRDDALAALLPAFGHRHVDVQRAALRLVTRHLDQADDALCERVALAAEGLAPSLRIDMSLRPEPSPAPATATLPNDRMPGPLDDVAFVQVAALMLEQQASPIEVERAIEAMLRICGYPPAQRRALVEPLLRRAGDPAMGRTELSRWAADCVRLLAGDTLAAYPRVEHLGDLLLVEVWRAIERGVARAYVAMPTRADGSIDAATAAERRRLLPDGVGPAEATITALRADDNRDLLRIEGVHVVVDPQQFRLARYGVKFSFGASVTAADEIPVLEHRDQWTYSYTVTGGGQAIEYHDERSGKPQLTGDPRSISALLTLGPLVYVGAEHLEWLYSTLPHHPDALTIPLAGSISSDMEREPSAFIPSELNTILDRATRPGTTPGACAPIVAAMALGAKSAGTRLRATECCATLVNHKGIAAGAIASPLAQLLTEQVVKPSRVASALAGAVERDPHLVRDLLLPILPVILGVRDAHRLLDALTEAVALTGPIPVAAELHELAVRTGTSKLLQSARHLVAVSTRSA